MTLTRPNYHNGTKIQIQIVINIEQFNIQVTESIKQSPSLKSISHVLSSRHQFAVAQWVVVLQQFAVTDSSLLSTVRRWSAVHRESQFSVEM